MKQRSITSVVILAFMLIALLLSKYIVYSVVIALLALTASFEVFRVMGMEKRFVIVFPAYIFAVIFPTLAYFVRVESINGFLLILSAAMFVYLLLLMAASVFSKGHVKFTSIAEVFSTTAYITVSFTSLSLIRYLDRGIGAYAVVLVFMVAWVCDVFAYAVGMLFGKHKLIPEISPKKTVEGSIGGIVFSALACIVYGLLLETFVDGMTVNYLLLGLIGAILSVVSQLGDLVASMIKREYGVKDYGKLFPGHGGVMDRFDSVIAVSTILLIICMAFPPFVIS
jgi:phosphatidate cytidylyltransferase